MNPFILPKPQLLQEWKNLRNGLSEKDDADALSDVMKFWSLAPTSRIAYDPEALDTYPTAWEMMDENDWCDNSVAVGMEFTLRLGGWDQSRLMIKMVKDYDLSIQRLVLFVDDKYLLNYQYGTIVEMPTKKFDVLSLWQFTGRKYQRLDK